MAKPLRDGGVDMHRKANKNNSESVPPLEGFIDSVKSCDSCRWTGTLGCAGIGTYMLTEIRKAKSTGHRAAIVGLAGVFYALSYYRWTADD